MAAETAEEDPPDLSGSTVRGVHIMLRSALDRAVTERLLNRNPADGCVVPKVLHQEMKTLRPEGLKAYLDAAEQQNTLAMFYLELVSGIRKGQLVALRWEVLDVEHQTFSVSKQAAKNENNHLIVARPKTENSVRKISIPQETVELLVQEEHRRFHNLRHIFATLALQNGVDIKTASAMPGHYDAGFTLRTYTHTPARSRTRQPRPWEASWRRYDK